MIGSKVNFKNSALFSLESYSHEPLGHTIKVFRIPTEQRNSTRAQVNAAIRALWGGALEGDSNYIFCKSKLAELDIDLNAACVSRGLDIEAESSQDLEVKDKGDLAELMAYITERDFRPVPEEDIFASLLLEKRRALSPITGFDGLAFLWEESDSSFSLFANERMIIYEWKHTSDQHSIATPCSRIAGFIKGLTFEKLFQELRRVKVLYQQRGLRRKAERANLFLLEFAAKSEHILFSSFILFDSIIPRATASSNVEIHLVKPVTSNPSLQIPPNLLQATLFPVDEFNQFYQECYQGLRPYPHE